MSHSSLLGQLGTFFLGTLVGPVKSVEFPFKHALVKQVLQHHYCFHIQFVHLTNIILLIGEHKLFLQFLLFAIHSINDHLTCNVQDLSIYFFK